MQQFIVAAAILPILLVFLLAFSEEGFRHGRILRLEEAVQSFRLEVALSGTLSSAAAGKTREEIAQIFQLDPEDVTVRGWLVPPDAAGLPERIRYEIAFPLRGRTSMARFFGFSEAATQTIYCTGGTVIRLKPLPKPAEARPSTVAALQGSEKTP